MRKGEERENGQGWMTHWCF